MPIFVKAFLSFRICQSIPFFPKYRRMGGKHSVQHAWTIVCYEMPLPKFIHKANLAAMDAALNQEQSSEPGL